MPTPSLRRLILAIASAGVLTCSLTSCTVLFAASEKYRPRFKPSDTTEEVHRKLGTPKSSTKLPKTPLLKDTPTFQERPKELSFRTKDKPVALREDFVTWGTYTHGAGGFSQQEGFALISGLSLFLLEPVIAPFATIHWIFGRFERNEVSVWYSPSGNYVDQHWK